MVRRKKIPKIQQIHNDHTMDTLIVRSNVPPLLPFVARPIIFEPQHITRLPLCWATGIPLFQNCVIWFYADTLYCLRRTDESDILIVRPNNSISSFYLIYYLLILNRVKQQVTEPKLSFSQFLSETVDYRNISRQRNIRFVAYSSV